MLKSPTRPRAPSAATLRVLYQLAYISSGTAVGIGALCAEERRRRTQIVQRVADNAKRIRQSPRYAHGAAAAALKQQDHEDNFGWFGQENDAENLNRTNADSAKAGKLEIHGGAKMPELPSVVEEEYGLLIEGNRKKSRRRNHTGRPDFVEEHGYREPVANTVVDARSDQQARTTPTSFVRLRSTNSLLETPGRAIDLEEKANIPKWEVISYKRPMRYGMPLEGDLEPQSRRKTLFHATKEGKAYHHPDDNYDTIVKHFDTHHLWSGGHSTGETASLDTLAQDVRLFFDKVDADALPRMSKEHARKIADELLRLSLGLVGSSLEIRSLLLWKIATGELSINDLYNLAASFSHIASELGPAKTVDFYASYFATSTYRNAYATEQLSVTFRLCAELLKLDSVDEHVDLYEQLTENITKSTEIAHYQAAELFEHECMRLIDHGHLPAAVKLWCMLGSIRKFSRAYSKLDNHLFGAAIHARHLSLCAEMLRIKDGSRDRNNSQQRDTFIRVCFEEGALGMLRSLFGRHQTGALTGAELSPQSYEYLCHCFGGTSVMFTKYYKKLPVELRASVAGAGVLAKASALKANWNSTRNLDGVRNSYEDRLSKVANYPSADLRPLHVAMIEVELSANQPLEAIGALSKLNEGGTDGSIATLTAVALAKQRNWLAFGRLFEALRQDPTELHWTPTMKQAYNNALHLFARSHTAQQLSDFVSMSINELRFSPNQSTWEILMSSLVSHRALVLLKHWIKVSHTSEGKVSLNAGIAAALMKTWYRDFRHSHVLVIWFCRTLAQMAPSLQGERLMDVIRETIAFDLRKLHGVNAPWMESIIRTRQTLYQQLSDAIPKPGYIWNGQLYDSGRLVTANEAPSPIQVPDEEDALSILMSPQTTETARKSNAVSAVETWTPFQEPDNDDEAYDAAEPIGSASLHKAPIVFNPTIIKEVEAVHNSVTEFNPFNADFEDLRKSYESNVTSGSKADTADEVSEIERLEKQMVIELSHRQYDTVLKLYQDSLDAVGLPASPMVLEIAVDASLRNTGDRHEAESIISAARDAGMNVTCAMGPLLIDQIRHTPIVNTQSAARLRSDAIEYYRMNELNGLHVKHRLGIHAAHTLVQAGFAEHGSNLLSTILQSSWSADKPLDIVAMSVWLSAYASLGHVKGMHWVVEEVLHQRMNIDQGFLRVLKRARRPVQSLDNGDLVYVKQDPKALAYLRQWYDVCSRRREAQMQESKVFGRKLVNLLASAANQQNPRTAEPRRVWKPLARKRFSTRAAVRRRWSRRSPV
jgi:hypothetical protein